MGIILAVLKNGRLKEEKEGTAFWNLYPDMQSSPNMPHTGPSVQNLPMNLQNSSPIPNAQGMPGVSTAPDQNQNMTSFISSGNLAVRSHAAANNAGKQSAEQRLNHEQFKAALQMVVCIY
ncbi:hypothetical protein QAD02_017167 [Eretmocerus hayati]|uniref:Uncharacterized protein n=1 Tax=Eretmocerus hayati TaxID=131215 RepID=A0ACC2PD80_9HYME|nr:hypothetical protein QAD02_017167 [Eretmocerus hayati]